MRSLIAIAAGAAIAAAGFQLGAIAALLLAVGLPLGAPTGPPGTGYYLLNLSLATVAAVLGGRVNGWLAGAMRPRTVPVLALLLAGLALWGFARPASQWPSWYPVTLALIGAVGTLLGGLFWPARST